MKNLPEKIYATPNFDRRWQTKAIDDESMEYVRTDVFIEKAKEFLSKESNILSWDDRSGNFGCDTSKLVENFIKYIEGE